MAHTKGEKRWPAGEGVHSDPDNPADPRVNGGSPGAANLPGDPEGSEEDVAALLKPPEGTMTDLHRLLPGQAGDVERGDLAMTTQYSTMAKASTALLYGASSIMIMVVNKDLLTERRFPSAWVLACFQMGSTVLVLGTFRSLGLISFPGLSWELLPKIFPLPFFYLGNMVCGLSGTKSLSLPMLTVLRRFSILMTMYGEQWFLNISQRFTVKFSVWVMIGGAAVAAAADLAFSLVGYTYVFVNNLSTAGNNIYTKKKLKNNAVGKYGLLFYNALFMLLPLCLTTYLMGEFAKVLTFDGWSDPIVIFEFVLSCVFALILNFAVMICTQYNTPLTTTIVGCLKNIIVTYYGMLTNSDYIFSMSNFIGVSISVFGSLLYSKVTFVDSSKSKSKKRPQSKVNVKTKALQQKPLTGHQIEDRAAVQGV